MKMKTNEFMAVGTIETFQRLKKHGWHAEDSEATGKDDSGKSL